VAVLAETRGMGGAVFVRAFFVRAFWVGCVSG
jgi:hypothetical protein